MKDAANNQANYSCPFLHQCSLMTSQQEKMPELIQRIRQTYCTDESAQCARRMICEMLGPAVVPPLMLPSQSNWALQIAEEYDDDNDAVVEPVTTQ
ncbi:MAG: hypothetical protein ABFR90_02345 [Planctomycetota bacterium]